MHYSYTIASSDNFVNVKDVLKSHFLVSTRLLNKLKKSNLIYINNIPVAPDKPISLQNPSYSIFIHNIPLTLDRPVLPMGIKSSPIEDNIPATLDRPVLPGETVSFSMDFDEDSSNIIPISMNLDIIYEDESFLIINKPANLAVHPTSYHFTDTLSNGIKYYFDSINLHKKIRIVNRLDKNTSGLVIIAKNEYVQEFLIKQMKTNNFIKKYIGIVEGTFSSPSNETFNLSPNNSFNDHSNLFVGTIKDPIETASSNKMNKMTEIKMSGTINAPIARKPNSIIERCISPLRRRGNYSL